MSTREIEKRHFVYFRNKLPDFPVGEVFHEDKPDFRIVTSNEILGVEHSLIHIPSRQRTPLQAMKSQADDIISLAKQHYELQGMSEVHASFLFNQFRTLRKKERSELAIKIARAISSQVIKGTKPFTNFDIREPNIPNKLSLIHFISVEKGLGNFWRCARAGCAMTNCKSLIQDIINNKAEKYSTYAENCSKCWLLIVADSKPSSFIHPDKEAIAQTYTSPFERVYFLDCSYDELHTLKTTYKHD